MPHAPMEPLLKGLRDVLKCDVANMHPGLLWRYVKGGNKYGAYKNCSKNIGKQTSWRNRCTDEIASICKKSSLVATKTIRLPFYLVDKLLSTLPSLKVIQYTRDPRGIMNSRRKLWHYDGKRLVQRARRLCLRMEADFRYYRSTSDAYPGRVMHLRYESLALHPFDTAQKLYNYVGHPLPSAVSSWLNESTVALGTGLRFGTKRNSKVTVQDWQSRLEPDIIEKLNGVCQSALRTIGYPINVNISKPMSV